MYYNIILLLFLSFCDGYNILLVFPIPGKSHSILGEGYVRNLIKAGHKVTYVTPIPMLSPPVGVRQVDISQNVNFFIDINIEALQHMDFQDQTLIIAPMFDFLTKTLQLEGMQQFMNDPNEKFDAVVVEWLYCELGAGLSTVFKAPLIWSSSMDAHTFVLSLINEHLNPAYTTHHLSREYPTSFWSRLYQLWSVFRIRYFKWGRYELENKIFHDVYGPVVAKKGRMLPDFDEVKYNGSLMLGNSHITTGIAIPLPQNYKHIGGYHLKETTDPLPKDLQNIMDNAKDGVIYFSLGSMLKGSSMKVDIKNKLIQMLGQLKQTVIWKMEETIPNLPKNVHVVSWAPQESILAHPKCLLFITHGGLLSIMEAFKYGTPIIGVPFYADQFLNINRAVIKGFGKRVDYNDGISQNLNEAIMEILQNSSYKQKVKEQSKIFHDRLVPPGKELVYWIEHVIKTNGAPHLRSPLLNISWYTRFYVDLVVLLVSVLIVCIILCKYLSTLLRINGSVKKKIL